MRGGRIPELVLVLGLVAEWLLAQDGGLLRAHEMRSTGPWIFGKKVLLPAGVINSADHNDEKVFVNRTKDQIKNAPEFDDSLTRDETYRGQLGSYYSRGGAGFRDWD